MAVAAGLFGLSFATVLFTLTIFKLLTFFIMPSLFFDLLFIGFPLGSVHCGPPAASGPKVVPGEPVGAAGDHGRFHRVLPSCKAVRLLASTPV